MLQALCSSSHEWSCAAAVLIHEWSAAAVLTHEWSVIHVFLFVLLLCSSMSGVLLLCSLMSGVLLLCSSTHEWSCAAAVLIHSWEFYEMSTAAALHSWMSTAAAQTKRHV